MTDISEGIRPAKVSATTACASLARCGKVVRLKISIAGPRGVVLGASVENAELARCCADALSKATFRPVQKAQLGAAATPTPRLARLTVAESDKASKDSALWESSCSGEVGQEPTSPERTSSSG